MAQRKSRVERFLTRIQKKPLVVGAIAIGTLVIAISSFTDAAKNLTSVVTGLRGPTPEEARAELSNLSVGYSEETYVERVREGDAAAAKLFLTAGMDPNLVADPEGNTVLMVAAANGRAELVDALLQAKADVKGTNRNGATALMSAATQSDPAIVRALIDAGADLHAKDGGGDNALSFAALGGQRENVVLLLDAGATTAEINRAFVSAALSREPEIARLLLDRGADITQAGPDALVRAISQDTSNDEVSETVRFVIGAMANVSGRDANGWTGLHQAATRGHMALMRLLLDKGADVNVVCKCNGYRGAENWTPLHMAAHNGRVEAAEALLAGGADLTPANTAGATPLHSATYSDEVAIVRAMLARGADANARDQQGRTPLIIAASRGQSDVLSALLAAGADVRVTDNEGKTALDYASDSPGNKSTAEIVRLLKQPSAR